MIITSIEKQKTNKKRYSVFIDYKFSFGVDEIDLLFYKLNEGDSISEEKLNGIMENVVFVKAREKALRALSFKALTEKELADKLYKEQFPSDINEKVIEFMKRYDYINDRKFAVSYVKERINIKNHGEIRIRYELRNKGMDEAYIDEAFLAVGDCYDPLEKALDAIKKKCKAAEIDFKEKRKLYGYLSRKGYEPEIIYRAIEEFEGKL